MSTAFALIWVILGFVLSLTGADTLDVYMAIGTGMFFVGVSLIVTAIKRGQP